ncbi:MAG: HAMP domain-containing histidine kinase [Bdellovibrionaceae bacterium]|nr:HAMP domain-containing histidine kinase [Pseudobdellovibrionaceae bacterium]
MFDLSLLHRPVENAKLLWIINLRWTALLLFALLCGPGLALGVLTRQSIPFYLGILGLLILFNLFSRLVIAESKFALSPFVVGFQLLFDLLMLTCFLMLTGGIQSPFLFLVLLNTSMGAILIQGRWSWPFAVIVHSLILLLQIESASMNAFELSPHHLSTFALQHLAVLSFCLIMRALGRSLETQNHRHLEAMVRVEKMDRLKSLGALTAGFSHEFASPLNTAKIRLERLSRQHDSEDAGIALAAVETCVAIVRQMNESQFDPSSAVSRDVDVSRVITDAAQAWLADKPNAQLQLSVQENLRARLPVLNFCQTFLNLLDNAHEAAPGKPVELSFSKSESLYQMSVRDSGPGFASHVLRHLGEPFLTTKEQGTGLGLYVSELFAQSLGGSLRLENLKEGGARVTLCWPTSGARA